MAKPPSQLYGKVHCTTLIRFSKREERAMLREYQRSFFIKTERSSQRNRRFGI